MGMNIDDEQLVRYLLKFITGLPVQCDDIRFVDLYGNKKPSKFFDTTTTNHYHYVFTQLKKKNKNFNRGIVGGGGSWKEKSRIRPVYDKNKSVIGLTRTFHFDEENHIWYMKEYHLSDNIIKDLSGRIRYEEFVVCRITRSDNVDASSSSQCQVTQENQDLDGNMIKESELPAEKEEECSVSVVHQETPSVSFIAKESNVAAANEGECSVSVVHQETLLTNVAAAKEEECSVPKPQKDEDVREDF